MGIENMGGRNLLLGPQEASSPGLMKIVRRRCGVHMEIMSTIRQRGMNALRLQKHFRLLHSEL